MELKSGSEKMKRILRKNGGPVQGTSDQDVKSQDSHQRRQMEWPRRGEDFSSGRGIGRARGHEETWRESHELCPGPAGRSRKDFSGSRGSCWYLENPSWLHGAPQMKKSQQEG